MKCDVLVCFAVKEEAAIFSKAVATEESVHVLVTGIGRVNAEREVRKFLATHSPQKVFTCGFAGGLSPKLKAGALVFFTNHESLRGELIAFASPARFCCASRIAITSAEKQALRASSGADAVEMESEAIHLICAEREVPCATLRAISDTAAEDLPLDFNQLSKPDMNLDYVKLVWAIAKSPWKIPSLMRLQKRCHFAAGQLAKALLEIIFC